MNPLLTDIFASNFQGLLKGQLSANFLLKSNNAYFLAFLVHCARKNHSKRYLLTWWLRTRWTDIPQEIWTQYHKISRKYSRIPVCSDMNYVSRLAQNSLQQLIQE